jgi:hypothetical protein
MNLSRRSWLAGGALLGCLSLTKAVSAQQPLVGGTAAGKVSHDQLGEMLRGVGLPITLTQQRYDFTFVADLGENQQWELSMSAVLSQDGESIWLMAWLDELPKTAAEVPREALLRLLAINDTLGNGKFFAYIPATRRFVLQRVIPNQNVTSEQILVVLQDLGVAVVDAYPYWNVANWNQPPAPTTPGAAGATAPGVTPVPGSSAANDSRFESPAVPR